MSSPQLITCPSCGTTNRVPRDKPMEQAVCGRCKSPLLAARTPVTVTDWNFPSEVQQSSLPVLLDLWAPWCGPCRMIAPVLEEIAAEMAGKIRVGKLNVDENPSTAARFQVRSIPTMLILRAGIEVDRIVGAQPKSEIMRRLQAALS